MVAGFLGPSDVAAIQEAVRQGLQTVLDLQEPPVFAVVRARGLTGDPVEADPVRVSVKGTRSMSGDRATEGAEAVLDRGTLRTWSPWVVERGNKFRLEPSGETGTILAVPPAKYGVQEAAVEFDR